MRSSIERMSSEMWYGLTSATRGARLARLRPTKILATTTPYTVSSARMAAGIMNLPAEVETTLREIQALASA